MKLPLILLLSALMTGTGIFVYDTVRADRRIDHEEAVVADRSQLEARVKALEERMVDHGPELRAIGNEDLMDRIVALETQLRATRAAAPASHGAGDAIDRGAPGDNLASRVDGDTDLGEGDVAALDERDVERVKRLMEAAELKRRQEWAARRLDRTLERLEIDLSEDDKKRVMEAQDAFRSTLRDAFRNAGGPGEPNEEMRTVMETARAEFTTTLESFLPSSDAEQLAQAMARPGGRRGPTGGGGGGGRGNR